MTAESATPRMDQDEVNVHTSPAVPSTPGSLPRLGGGGRQLLALFRSAECLRTGGTFVGITRAPRADQYSAVVYDPIAELRRRGVFAPMTTERASAVRRLVLRHNVYGAHVGTREWGMVEGTTSGSRAAGPQAGRRSGDTERSGAFQLQSLGARATRGRRVHETSCDPVACRPVIGITPVHMPPGIPSGECDSTPIPLIPMRTAMPSDWPVTSPGVSWTPSFEISSSCERVRSTDAPFASIFIPAMPDPPRSLRRSWTSSLGGETNPRSPQKSELPLHLLKRWSASEMGVESVMKPGVEHERSSTTRSSRGWCTPLGSSGSGTRSTWPSSFRLGHRCRNPPSRRPGPDAR